VTLCRRVQAVPSDDNGAGPLIRVEPQQEIGEADYGASRAAVGGGWLLATRGTIDARRSRRRLPTMGNAKARTDRFSLRGFAVLSRRRSDGLISPFCAEPSLPRLSFGRRHVEQELPGGSTHREVSPIRAHDRWPLPLVIPKRVHRIVRMERANSVGPSFANECADRQRGSRGRRSASRVQDFFSGDSPIDYRLLG
jgi:hypothetical protein